MTIEDRLEAALAEIADLKSRVSDLECDRPGWAGWLHLIYEQDAEFLKIASNVNPQLRNDRRFSALYHKVEARRESLRKSLEDQA